MSIEELNHLSSHQGSTEFSLLEETIGQALERISTQHPDNLALVVRHQEVSYSYKEFNHQVDKLAKGLLALGINSGDRVGIWAPNCVEWVLTQYATAKIGAVMTCINPAYRVHELEYALNKVECRAIITAENFKSSKYLDMLQTLAPELNEFSPQQQVKLKKLPYLECIIRLGDEATNGMFNFNSVLNMAKNIDDNLLQTVGAKLSNTDAINIQFTSGTTGKPKGATLTHRNILNNANFTAKNMLFTENDKLCIPVPMYHCFGMVLGTLVCMTSGATAVLPAESFEPLTTLQAVADERCTALHGVPTMFIAEMEHEDFSQFDLSSLRTGIMAGSPCPIEVMKSVIDKMHMHQVLIVYGQTELSPMSHMTLPDDPIDKRVSTVGKPASHCEVKLVDEDNNIVPIGQKGEICTRGYSVMLGYWNDEERTVDTIDVDGFLHSGDLGIMDEEGYVQVVGRLKDMIIRGGENIYPREIEEFLYTIEQVQDVQVFGIPHEKLGEQVVAWISLKEDGSITENEIKAICKENIAHFKVPSIIKFVKDYPMTVTGKIQKFKMRDMMVEELAT